jgi:hypothetical protein
MTRMIVPLTPVHCLVCAATLLNVAPLAAAEVPAAPTAPPAERSLVEPSWLRRLVVDGKHNAFTALVRWQDQVWLAFRKGTDHGSTDGNITLLRSADAETWTEALSLDILADDRDAQLLATPDRLLLYSLSWTENRQRLQSCVSYTEDGDAWSDPQPVYEPGYFLWKPTAHAGRFYAGAHRKGSMNERGVNLIAADDGIAWQKVSTIRAGQGESETTLLFGSEGRLTAFVRNMMDLKGSIREASPPYAEWTERTAGHHLSGHSVHEFNGVTYLISRHLDDRARAASSIGGLSAGTMIFTYEDGQLRPYCLLPGRHDCSYAGAVQVSDQMLVSYYSSHEYPDWVEKNGPADIYLAWVPLKK